MPTTRMPTLLPESKRPDGTDSVVLAVEHVARGAAHDRQVMAQHPARQARPLVDQFRQCAAALGIQRGVEQRLHHQGAA